jgi:CheY-like chemotaxis protein
LSDVPEVRSSETQAKRILICDDEVAMRLLIRVVLTDEYEFNEAADGFQALELARRTKPDLVVLDVMLPGGDGLALLERLRAEPLLRDVPAIVLTASPDYETAALAVGAERFITKPFDPDDLRAAVKDLVGSP